MANHEPSTTHIFDFMERHFANVKIDKHLCERINRYVGMYMHRNSDHTAFFGGVLLGVNPIRFFPTDRDNWFTNVLGVSDDIMAFEFKKLPVIDETHNVQSDVMNHIPAYLVRKIYEARDIASNVKEATGVSLFLLMHIKFLTSLLEPRFRFPAKREVAEATFMSLDYKWDIRRLGSWDALLRDRAYSVMGSDTNYTPHIYGGPGSLTDYWCSRIVSDTQTRIRVVINRIYSVYMEVLKAGGRIVSVSELGLSTDGEEFLKDKTTGFGSYLRYGKEVATNAKNFIRPELMGIVESAMVESMPPEPFEKTLHYLCTHVGMPRFGHIDKLLEESLLYVFEEMQADRQQIRQTNDLRGLLMSLRGKIVASRSSDPRVMYLRDAGEKLVKDATGITRQAVLAACRTGVLLYIALRTITKNHYAA